MRQIFIAVDHHDDRTLVRSDSGQPHRKIALSAMRARHAPFCVDLDAWHWLAPRSTRFSWARTCITQMTRLSQGGDSHITGPIMRISQQFVSRRIRQKCCIVYFVVTARAHRAGRPACSGEQSRRCLTIKSSTPTSSTMTRMAVRRSRSAPASVPSASVRTPSFRLIRRPPR